MPQRLPTPCAWPRCPELSHGRFCAAHQTATAIRYDTERGSAASRGYGHDWRKLRTRILRRDPACLCPRLAGCDHAAGECASLSTDVDHVTPKRQGGTYSPENLRGMCHACHSPKTAREDGRWATRQGGRP